MFTYLYSTEKIAAKKSKGEVLLFRRGNLSESKQYDIEASSSSKLSSPVEGIGAELPKKISASIQDSPSSKLSRLAEDISVELPKKVCGAIQRQTAVFQWKNICFDIKMKKETRRILDHVDGWVKPGTLTALVVCHSLV
jgi:ATP-binding cassette subfamily G (WHITE) protein 2 (PDR)